MSEYNETGIPPHHIPNFQSREELAAFWDTHSFTDYLEDLESAEVETMEIMQDEELMTAFRQGVKELAEGKGRPWEDVKKELGLDDDD